jgi:uncharacterized protein HemX
MNARTIIAIVFVGGFVITVYTYATAQQAPQTSQCPDYSQQLAAGLQAYNARDAWQGQAMQLDRQLTAEKAAHAEAEKKVTADDAIIASLRKQLADLTGKPQTKEPEGK